MSFANKLPSVLVRPRNNSISMERALKNIKEQLEFHALYRNSEPWTDEEEDRFNSAMDDLDTMLNTIDRGD